MNKSKVIIPLLVTLVFLTLAPMAVRADKPYRKYAYHGVTPVSGGKWIECYQIISWETEQVGVYRVSVSYTFAWVGSEEVYKITVHYKGTSKSATSVVSSNFITGKAEYNCQDNLLRVPHGYDEYDGNYRIWFENGSIVRQEGKGYLGLF